MDYFLEIQGSGHAMTGRFQSPEDSYQMIARQNPRSPPVDFGRNSKELSLAGSFYFLNRFRRSSLPLYSEDLPSAISFIANNRR